MTGMKKKVILSIAAITVLAAAIFAVIAIKNAASNDDASSDKDLKTIVEPASFDMEYPERLCGYPADSLTSNSSTIEVPYGKGGFVRKTLGVNDNSGDNTAYSEINEQTVNGRTVTVKGDEGLIRIAVWTDNNFAYTIKLNEGVSIDEMTEYIKVTR